MAWLPAILSLLLALALTPLVGWLARRRGLVAQPRSDRWHRQPTALLGGIAIVLAVVGAVLTMPQASTAIGIVVAASVCLGILGLVDDLYRLKPYQKLIGQVIAAAAVAFLGLSLPWTPSPILNLAVTLIWLVGITNALNLLDNMDGLATGVGIIAAGFLAFHFVDNGQTAEAVLMLVLVGALVGFLVYNWCPASIFMGDCGSMFLGFFLASGALLSSSGGRARGFLPILAVPVLILFIPIFDTILVTILRRLAGRPVSQGGRDHASHRLVALGLSEPAAVGLLYGLAALSGGAALLVRDLPVDLGLAILASFTLLLTLAGIYLAQVKVYREEEFAAARETSLVAFLFDLSHKRRLFEVCLDVVLIILAYYFARLLLFGPLGDHGEEFLQVVSLLVVAKIAAFWALGVYQGLWRYVGLHDIYLYARAVAASSVVGVLLILALYRFEGFSRAVFVVDGLLLFLLLGGSRIGFRLVRKLLPAPALRDSRRALIYGAGDAGELLLHELLNNQDYQAQPVAFVDDDPAKQGKVIHGLPVHAGNGHLPDLCADERIALVLISSMKFSDARVRDIQAQCQQAGVALKRLRIVMEDLTLDEEATA